ncbi:MAG: YbaK/EbsC family protein [Actinomycetia bacterium]|nr:YbaK/EbsC family protein [Actinomycetes bacterium]
MTGQSGRVEPKRTGSAGRVLTFLEDHGLADGVVHFEQSTKTAQMAAGAMGCQLGQIVKSLVFVADDRPLLALVAGDRRGDAAAIAGLMGAQDAVFADAETVRSATGYAIGGVSPFALPEDLPVFVDESLTRFDIVYPAGGTPSSMVRVTLPQLLAVTGGQLGAIAR